MGAYFPVRKDVVEAAVPWTKSPSTYISNGPFKLTEIKPKEKYVLKKNPNYVDASKVKLETLEIVFIEAAEAELAAYLGGSINVSDNMSAESVKMFEKTPEFNSIPRIGLYYFDINTAKKPFDDAPACARRSRSASTASRSCATSSSSPRDRPMA